jgi:DNA modification methylase
MTGFRQGISRKKHGFQPKNPRLGRIAPGRDPKLAKPAGVVLPIQMDHAQHPGFFKNHLLHYNYFLKYVAYHLYSFKIGLTPEKVVSWVYNSNTGKQHRDIAFFGVKPDFRKVGQDYKNPKDKRIAKRILEGKKAKLYDWWEINQVKNVSLEKTEHPCQMPLKVMENIIGILPDEYTIIDPFLGSGTTALACQKYGRKFIVIELDFKYFEISKQRILDVYKK